MIDVDVRTFLIATLGDYWAEPGFICQGFGAQFRNNDHRIWYRRSGYINDLLTSGISQITTTTFDIECLSNDLDEAQSLAATLKEALNGFAGAFGDSTALLCEITDHNDDYQPQGLGDEDEIIEYAALSLSITHLNS